MTDDFLATGHVLHLHAGLTPVVLNVQGKAVPLLELDTRLSFARKAARLSELAGGDPEKVYVYGKRVLTALEFDVFANCLLRPFFGEERNGPAISEGRTCILVCAPGRSPVFVDTQGSDYARYVAQIPGAVLLHALENSGTGVGTNPGAGSVWHALAPAQRLSLEGIAQKTLRLQTLDAHNSDRLDFHEVHVHAVREALAQAWYAGAAQGGLAP